ncbi:MAG TPA: hypothetical protein DDW52_15265 [Planctomycetaceae bacterium]|nr:hypothetical protein [Planctomycetaceae bacterium]
MARYMFLYRESPEQLQHQPSPEEMQQVMQLWTNWMQQGAQAGWLIDGGDALKPESRSVDASLEVSDTATIEAKEVVGGYSLIEAASLEEAIEIAKGSPMPHSGGSVEVRLVGH